MKWHHLLALAMLAQPLVMTSASAQQGGGPAQLRAQTGEQGLGGFNFRQGDPPQPVGDPYAYPEGVALAKSELGPVHVDAQGMTLYKVNGRLLRFIGRSSSLADTWTPFAAPAGAKPIGYWGVMSGENGSQWMYKGDPVFRFNGDKEPAALGGHQFEGMWQAVFFVPPAPEVKTPGSVQTVWHLGQYLFADKEGRALYANSKNGSCGDACADWVPFAAGLASHGVGEWTIIREGDRAQWAYQSKPVYVSAPSMIKLPDGAANLKPPAQWTYPGPARP
jgi:predicted lipoprotein with Yx(FWY)xxD motif